MLRHVLQFISVIAIALSMAGGFAHLFELPNKIRLPENEYLVVQQIYRGWAWLGAVILVALGATALLAVLDQHRPLVFALTLGAAVLIVISLVVFFTFTFPTNRATANWTRLPVNWETLRRRWEYSHAVGACLYFAALCAMTLSLIV